MLVGMDRNTMIVTLVEALLWFAALVVIVLRLDRLWLRLRELQLRVGESIKVSARFFRQERCAPPLIRGRIAHLLAGDQLTIDRLIITHPDDDHLDHQMLIVPHHGRRPLCG
jgi:hypothetical protein